MLYTTTFHEAPAWTNKFRYLATMHPVLYRWHYKLRRSNFTTETATSRLRQASSPPQIRWTRVHAKTDKLIARRFHWQSDLPCMPGRRTQAVQLRIIILYSCCSQKRNLMIEINVHLLCGYVERHCLNSDIMNFDCRTNLLLLICTCKIMLPAHVL